MLCSRALFPIGVLLLLGCQSVHSPSPSNHAAEVEALRAVELAEEQAWISKDLDKAVSFYADDAVLMNNNSPIVRGKDQIRALIKPEFDNPDEKAGYEILSVDVAQSGEIGYTAGTWFVTSTDPRTRKAITNRGSWITVRKKQADGQWKIVYDIGNSGPSAAPAGKP